MAVNNINNSSHTTRTKFISINFYHLMVICQMKPETHFSNLYSIIVDLIFNIFIKKIYYNNE